MRELGLQVCATFPFGKLLNPVPDRASADDEGGRSSWISRKIVLLALLCSREQVDHIAGGYDAISILRMGINPAQRRTLACPAVYRRREDLIGNMGTVTTFRRLRPAVLSVWPLLPRDWSFPEAILPPTDQPCQAQKNMVSMALTPSFPAGRRRR